MTNQQPPADTPKPATAAQPKAGGGYRFGAFKGVFTPSILTILGVIMYLRIGWVLGNAGLPLTLLIVTMASTITFLTGLSLSALATNMKVKGGGAYYIISRSLGVEIGGAIGLPLFLAQALGVAFYIAGFSEAVVDVFPQLDATSVGVITLTLLTLVAFISADLALKSQFIVMTAIAVSLVSFFWGAATHSIAATSAAEVMTEATPALRPFWIVFAVFFPAVTGIEAGVSMSGDLDNPAKSLPRGTLAAVVVGYLVYLLIPLSLAYVVRNAAGELDRQRLLADLLVMSRVAHWEKAVVAGVWAAALSSAMGAILGAPRTLQAMARDRIVPRLLGRGFGRGNDPRIATVFCFAIALIGVMAGDLNLIAPILSMFFLTSYGLLNISAGLEELTKPPSWRPTFRVAWPLSLIGSLACFGAMFMISAGATIVALATVLTVYWAMKRRRLRARWGDMRIGVLMQIAQYAIYTLARTRLDERNWKPNILVLGGNPTSRWYLIELASAISQGRGFLTVATIVPESTSAERRLKMEQRIADFLDRKLVPGMAKVYRAESPLKGALKLATTYGFGPISPNTLLFGETEKEANYRDFSSLVCSAQRNNLNLVIVREGEGKTEPNLDRGVRIDVWWGGQQQNVGFMLALSHLLTGGEGWREATLNLRTIVSQPKAVEGTEESLREFIDKVRLRANPLVTVRQSPNVFEQIRQDSQGADLVFLGMRHPEPEETDEEYAQYYADLLRHTDDLPPTALCMASEKIKFNAIFAENTSRY